MSCEFRERQKQWSVRNELGIRSAPGLGHTGSPNLCGASWELSAVACWAGEPAVDLLREIPSVVITLQPGGHDAPHTNGGIESLYVLQGTVRLQLTDESVRGQPSLSSNRTRILQG